MSPSNGIVFLLLSLILLPPLGALYTSFYCHHDIVVLLLFISMFYFLLFEGLLHEFEYFFYCNSCAELQVICTVKKHILTGGPKRLPFTVPPLVFSCLKVCICLSNSFNKCKMFFCYI